MVQSFYNERRPHVVWFGELVPMPMIGRAAELCAEADLLLVIGTSMQVYPAAGLIDLIPAKAQKFLVVHRALEISAKNIEMIPESSVTGVPMLVGLLLDQ